MRRFAILLTASTILAAATPSFAQEGETAAFRVELGGGNAETGVPASYAWLENIGACSTTCGTGTRVTTYQCQNVANFDYTSGGYGPPEDESYCTHTNGAKPADSTSSCTVYSGCSYDWVNPPVEETPIPLDSNPVGRVGCGYVNETFSPYCQRTGGATSVVLGATDHEFCSGDRPDYDPVAAGDPDALGFDRNVTQTGACTTVDHDWQRGAWGPWSNTCSATATRTRSVVCKRRFDGTTQADSNCDQSEDHSAIDIRPIYSGCSYSRGNTVTNTGPWEDGCATNTSRTLTYNCLRSDGTSVDADECTSRSVSLTRTETGSNYASCTYAWTPNDTTTGWGPSSNTCSSSAAQTRSVICKRSNGDTVADSNCTGTRPATTRTVADYSGCSYARGTTVTNTGPWASSCSSNTSRTLTYNCRRSDGTTVAASECTSRSVSLTQTETGSNYSGCSYARGAVTNTGAWASGCSSSTTRTLTHACRRSDGTNVSASECTSRSISLTTTETGANYAGCSYAWNAGSWSASSNTCSSSATQTRSVVCRRSDGTNVSDGNCSGTKPATSRTVADYSSCTYAWNTGSWGPSSNTCSSSATQTRTVTCRRSNGSTVSDSNCSGTRPASSRTIADYSSCSYARGSVTNTGAWASNCSSSTTRTLTHACRRSDGTNVSSSECTNRSISLTTTETGANYAGCTYAWNTGSWGASSNTCSATATQSRYVTCRRSNGSTVADSNCTGTRPASSRTVADYSTCSYSRGRQLSETWNSNCSTNATRTRTYACVRSDGTEVSASNCTSRSISVTDTYSAARYTSCNYTLIDGGVGACSMAGQRSHYWECRRDQTGQMVDSQTYCGRASTTTESCTPPYTYSRGSATGSSWSSGCSQNATKTTTYSCRRNDGVNVAASNCTSRGISLTSTTTGANYSSCTYTPTYGSWSTCAPPGTQSSTISSCRRDQTGQTVATSYCVNSGHSNSRSRSCTVTPGTGPRLGSRQFGGTGQFCEADTQIPSSRPGFPTWCRNAGGTYLERRSTYCERTRDPYGEPYEQEYWEHCYAY